MLPSFIGFDVETTGLSDNCLPLEIALVVFDEQINPMGQFTQVIHCDKEALDGALEPGARAMHLDNGLYNEVLKADSTVGEVERNAIRWLRYMNATNLPMLGSSITFDRNVLKRTMPELFDMFHYRSLDATSVKLAAQAFNLSYPAGERNGNHRALGDVYDSASLVRRIMSSCYTVGNFGLLR